MHPDLKIKIPRACKGDRNSDSAQGYWGLVRKHGKSRKAMVDFICGIGGYSNRDVTSAIEFSIKAYNCDLGADHLWGMLTSGSMDVGPNKDLPPEHMARAKAMFYRVYEEHEEHLWEWGCEEAYEGWRDSDTPFETFTGERVDWAWEIHGRCGGHLCMTKCEGVYLEQSTESLRADLLNRDPEQQGRYDVVSNANLRKLFIICVQNTIDLTHRRICEEVEYRTAWRLWVSFCEDELDAEIAAYEARAELSAEAAGILETLQAHEGEDCVAAFEAICKLADVKIPE